MRGPRRRKELAWKKNRRFGDQHGGRMRPKIRDGIFRRLHSLRPPPAGLPLPILIEDNPSRDFFFPLNGEEVLRALESLPAGDVQGITHVWLRRCRRLDYERGRVNLAEFVCGSGVRVIVLYPWPRDRTLLIGKDRPPAKLLAEYEKWSPGLVRRDGAWRLRFEPRELKALFVEHLLFHEVGHHIDWFQRHWSAANIRECEEFANQYAMARSATATKVIDRLEGT